MWIPATLTVCLLTPNDGIQCIDTDLDAKNAKGVSMEYECVSADTLLAMQWAVSRGVPVVSIQAECRQREGDPA